MVVAVAVVKKKKWRERKRERGEKFEFNNSNPWKISRKEDITPKIFHGKVILPWTILIAL